MNTSKLKKLELSQETLRNLTRGQRRETAGRNLSIFPVICPTGLTCPECNPPALQD